MTTKLKNRLQKMKFQRNTTRKTEVEKIKDARLWDEILRKRTMELIEKAA